MGLLNSLARLDEDQERLEPIPGQPPSLITPAAGLRVPPALPFSQGREICRTDLPELRDASASRRTQRSACHFAEELAGAST